MSRRRVPGADPGFSFRGGGGAQKIMWAQAHYERENRSPFRQGSRACMLKGPGSFKGLLMLFRAIWALFFKHSDKKKELD